MRPHAVFFNFELESIEGHSRVFIAADGDTFEEPTEVGALLAGAPDAEVVNTIQYIRLLFVL